VAERKPDPNLGNFHLNCSLDSPFIEKWVIWDEGVRWKAIEVARTLKLKDLLSVVGSDWSRTIDDLTNIAEFI